ncbi:spore germination protein GerKA [Halalkalibacter wakoensis JCM 9140]|uniref:Spore germination protein GerKA n=1 Tax=Halalkalibacter wakoensis JCM 9140 TaxID=1236970 RepID=W4PXQ1_9BACI|nr:spore germination protein [Halalkalibacter wakoensis]GAE24507.1 spore germination protein GerKA [Halalkalibacter wakoensis JCM 9140]
MKKVFKQIISSMKVDDQNQVTTPEDLIEDQHGKRSISPSIKKNEEVVNKEFAQSYDFISEKVFIGKQEGLLCYLTSMVDPQTVSETIRPALADAYQVKRDISKATDFDQFQKEYFSSNDTVSLQYNHEVLWYILSGYTILLVDGVSKGLAISTITNESRGVEQSKTQTIIRGPQDSFTEAKSTNVSLIRRRIKNPHLKVENFTVGKDTQTAVCVAYLDHVASKEIVDEVKKRVQEIKGSAVFDSGNIEEFISDRVITPFPMLYHTDRPDTVAADIVEGKVAVIVDGTPFVLLAPVVFTDFFQVSEDYYQGFMMASMLRMLRYLAFLIALLLPSMYIGLTTYHHQLIPTGLIVSIQAQREGVPFPAVVELLLMEVTFEILREAGVRMPRVVGQTVSIVGALVIGQAAVEAGIVSHFLVIIVALTAMAGFVSPVYSFANATRLLRFMLILMTAALGLFGTLTGFLLIIAHLASLRSFGVPYLAPMGPFILEDQKDVFVRLPIQLMKRRPNYLHPKADVKEPQPQPLPSQNQKEEQS